MVKAVLPLSCGFDDTGAKSRIAYISIANHTVGTSKKTMLTQNSGR